MRYYIIAGEASGDMHAANLMKALKQKDGDAVFRCWGGDLMKEQGGDLVKHYKELAFMGFLEVIKNIKTIFRNLKLCEKDILLYKPDVVILVDYPGFNLRIAKFAKKHHLKVVYYISPQVWAWKKSRVKLIKKVVDKMLVILPFEKNFYKRYGYDVDFVGHPLLDALNQNSFSETEAAEIPDDKPVVALLPGSRTQEVEKMLPQMLAVVPKFPEYQFVVCAVNSVNINTYMQLSENRNVLIVRNKTYDVLKKAYAALVTSGTATLETALFNVPQVVCYDANYFSYLIAKSLIKLQYISLVNLIMNERVVTELIQQNLNKENLYKELLAITKKEKRQTLLEHYKLLREKLGGSGASEKAANIIYKLIG